MRKKEKRREKTVFDEGWDFILHLRGIAQVLRECSRNLDSIKKNIKKTDVNVRLTKTNISNVPSKKHNGDELNGK